MAELDDLGVALKAYTFFGAPPPDVDPDNLIEYVREGLSEVSGKTSGKDPIIGGIRLLGELKVLQAMETLKIAKKDNNNAVREEADKAIHKILLR